VLRESPGSGHVFHSLTLAEVHWKSIDDSDMLAVQKDTNSDYTTKLVSKSRWPIK